jgi:hypothetical protein
MHHHVRSPEDVFRDFHVHHTGIIKALTIVLDFRMLELTDTNCFCGDTRMWISSTSSV